ncbi:hypothetical protein SD961_05700 [Erwinia sp. MMLR14_017]|nr:hypothetical protein [Erwinia sp. MMLR14_017]MDW8845392.1 hypothetical protein [Erwinia sp. MMLR14_017]
MVTVTLKGAEAPPQSLWKVAGLRYPGVLAWFFRHAMASARRLFSLQ